MTSTTPTDPLPETAPPTPLVDSPPVVMSPRSDGVEIVWSVTGHARGWVEWIALPHSDDRDPIDDSRLPTVEREVADLDRYGFVPQGTRVLRVRIDGWQPGSDYLIRTITRPADSEAAGSPTASPPTGRTKQEETSDWKRVRTLDPSADATSFVVWNDTHQRSETLQRLDDASPRADFLVWNGDVCNNWNDPEEIVPTILKPAGRDITVGRPMAFVWGNHDVRGPWAYRLPEVIATPEDRPYYAFRSGPVAAIFLNTGEDKPDDHPSFRGRPSFERLREVQAEWLAEQIRQPGFVDAPYRVLFCHMPLRWISEPVLTEADYADTEFDHYARTSRELWHDSLVAWGTQVIVSGHTHKSSWIPADDSFPYAQLTGGAPQSWAATWITGTADNEQLTLTAHRLDTSVLHQATFAPLT